MTGRAGTVVYLVAVVAAAVEVLCSGIDGDWTETIAWVVVILWASAAHVQARRADRTGTAYVLTVARGIREYERGYGDGQRGDVYAPWRGDREDVAP